MSYWQCAKKQSYFYRYQEELYTKLLSAVDVTLSNYFLKVVKMWTRRMRFLAWFCVYVSVLIINWSVFDLCPTICFILQFNLTPLHLAAWYGQQAVVELLLQHGANVNAVDRVSWWPLVFLFWQYVRYAVLITNSRQAKTFISSWNLSLINFISCPAILISLS